MSADGREFIERDDVSRALDELFEECAAARAAGESPSPDVASFLRERGIAPPPESPLRLHHGTEPPGRGTEDGEGAIGPTVRTCDDGTWCVWRCTPTKHGGRSCEWVCA